MEMGTSVQKVSAAMRKAGIKAAHREASGMVRGWGTWSSGVRVYKAYNDRVGVYWQDGHWAKNSPEQDAANLAKITEALDAAGLTWEVVKNVAFVS
jgi:hypothetical protein